MLKKQNAVFCTILVLLAFGQVLHSTNKIGLNIGDKAPELSFRSATGELIALSSLKGQIVLIEFWASWCGPCRNENTNLVSVYKEFNQKTFTNGKGFTIYGISLDRKKEDWVKAVQDDGLIWKNQVSDLNGWQSAAKTYQINAIPGNYLINGAGIIIAKNVKSIQLRKTLEQLAK